MTRPEKPRAIPAAVAVALVASLGVHAALFLSSDRRVSRTAFPISAKSGIAGIALPEIDALARTARVRSARADLVASARAARDAGRLALGSFLLEASRIDADEAGRPLDVAAATLAYQERVDALRAARDAKDLRGAVAEVFADLRYFGRPGGLVADALLEKGGSCEPIAHLVVAALVDTDVRRGDRASVELRFYGEPVAGVAHVAPIVVAKGEAFDLMSGRKAAPGGARVQPADLVEIYARTHGLAPPIARDDPGRGAAPADGSGPRPLPSMAAGYPPNTDRYPGSLPLFSARAIREPSDAKSDDRSTMDDAMSDARGYARECAYVLRMAVLSPPVIAIERDPTSVLEPRRQPKASELERSAFLMRATEDILGEADADDADRLMSLACLKALGERAAVDFTLAGERSLALEASRKARRAAELGRQAVRAASREPGSPLERRLAERYAGRTWLLLVLDGGERIVVDLVRYADKSDWGQVNALAGLVVAPHTRKVAYEILHDLTRREQLDVMHEVFHAHDHMRPWATSFDLDTSSNEDPNLEFARAYRVFRALAWRLWEGNRPVDETSAALSREASAAGLDPEWESVIFEYYARNALGLNSHRPGGPAVARELLAAARERPHASLDVLRHRLEFIATQPVLDARTISSAWRLP